MAVMTISQTGGDTVATASARTQSHPAPSNARRPRGRAATITLWTVQILLGAMFAFGGASKLFNLQPEIAPSFARIGLGAWFQYFVGALEVAGGIGLLIPRLSPLAALGLVGVMIGAALTHVLVLPPAYFAAVPAVIGVVLGLIARARWSEIQSLLDRLPR